MRLSVSRVPAVPVPVEAAHARRQGDDVVTGVGVVVGDGGDLVAGDVGVAVPGLHDHIGIVVELPRDAGAPGDSARR